MCLHTWNTCEAEPGALSCCTQRLCLHCPLQEEFEQGNRVGLDISTGEPLDPQMAGIYDNYLVKKQIIQSAPVIASQLLLVDEVMRAGMNMRK